MKKFLYAFLACLMLLFPACTGKEGNQDLVVVTTEDGYQTSDQVFTGGSVMTGINLRQASVSQSGDLTKVKLRFVDGSDLMGIAEADLPEVPSYTTDWFEGADRFVLHLQGVVYWDYLLEPLSIDGTSVQGFFYMQGPDEKSQLVIQLNEHMDFRLETEGGDMTLTFRPTGEEQENRWYISVNGYEMYYGGAGTQDLSEMGFAPCLCSDGISTVLLSVPFDTKEAAETYLTQNADTLSYLLPGLIPVVVPLASNRLPEYDAQSGIQALTQTALVSINGTEVVYPVLQANGVFLCWLPDGSGYFYARTLSGNAGEGAVYEELRLNRNGEDRALIENFEFQSISSASCSADGSYIAVSEQTLSQMQLEIFNIQTQEVYAPSEDGFGETTSCFAWDGEENILYAVTGDGETMGLYAYDLTDPDHPVVSPVGSESLVSNPLYWAQGALWSCQWDEANTERVASIDPQVGTVSYYQEASQLLMNPQRTAYAAVASSATGGSTLTVADARTGEPSFSVDCDLIIDMTWDATGETLYLTAFPDGASWEDEYPLVLYACDRDGHLEALMNVKTGALYPSTQAGELLMLYIFSQQKQAIPISFRISVR